MEHVGGVSHEVGPTILTTDTMELSFCISLVHMLSVNTTLMSTNIKLTLYKDFIADLDGSSKMVERHWQGQPNG